MADRKKEITVRHRMFNQDEIALQRKVRNPYTLWLGSHWKDWKLLNQDRYEVEEKIIKSIQDIEENLFKLKDLDDFLKQQIKEVKESSRQGWGYSAPFNMLVKVKEIPFKSQRWGTPSTIEWQKLLSPVLMKKTGNWSGGKGKGTIRENTRDKVGASDINPGTSTVYTQEQLSSLSCSLDEEWLGVDRHMNYKEPQKKKNKQQKNKRQHGQNNNRDD